MHWDSEETALANLLMGRALRNQTLKENRSKRKLGGDGAVSQI
jgi:hypothetical protein